MLWNFTLWHIISFLLEPQSILEYFRSPISVSSSGKHCSLSSSCQDKKVSLKQIYFRDSCISLLHSGIKWCIFDLELRVKVITGNAKSGSRQRLLTFSTKWSFVVFQLTASNCLVSKFIVWLCALGGQLSDLWVVTLNGPKAKLKMSKSGGTSFTYGPIWGFGLWPTTDKRWFS